VTFDYAAYLTDGLRGTGWVTTDLWIATVGLGGRLDLSDVRNITFGQREPSRQEYNMLALALNEQFHDLGKDHPMHYWEELPRI